LWGLFEITIKLEIHKKYLGCVGRGVLRFWDARYRKPRSNFDGFWDFVAISGIGGVDIILWLVVG